jgi:hypothetical protein
VELRCIGAARAEFALTYVAGSSTVGTQQDIVCQNGALRTPIAIPTAMQNLTSFTVSATSSDGEGSGPRSSSGRGARTREPAASAQPKKSSSRLTRCIARVASVIDALSEEDGEHARDLIDGSRRSTAIAIG